VIDLSEQAELLRQAQARLRQLEDAQQRQTAAHQAVLDALPAHVALLDACGVVLSVNQAWRQFALGNGGACSDLGVGQSYPLLCDAVVGAERDDADQAAQCIRAVLGQPGTQRSFEYPCHSPTEERWFRMTVAALPAGLGDATAGGVVVMHVDISERWRADAGARQTSALLQAVVDGTGDHVFVKDLQSRYLLCNQALAQFLGRPAEELIGQDNSGLLLAQDALAPAESDRQVFASGLSLTTEYTLSVGGQTRSFSTTKAPYRDEQGRVIGLIGISRDITERKKAEQERERQRVLMRTLIDAMPDVVYSMDTAARGVICNLAAARAFGVDGVEDLVGKTALDVFGTELGALRHAEDLQVLAGHAVLRREVPGTDLQGRPIWSKVTKLPLRDERGGIVGFVGIHLDITEAKQAEWALRQQQALLGMVLRLARIGAWALDLAEDLVMWSDEVCAIHEVPPGSSPTFAEAVAYYPVEWAGIVNAATTACATYGTPFDIEAELITARGRRIWVRVIGEATLDAQGRTQRIQGAIQDLSERKQAEQETRQLAAHLSDTIESITDGFYTVDRDWRITHANGELLVMAGCRREDVIGRALWDAFPDIVGTPFEQAYRRAMHERVAVTSEAWFSPLGCWISARAFPSQAGLTVQVRDVSAQRAARRHLELLEASVSQLNDVVLIAETAVRGQPGLRILFVNQAFVRATGHAREDVIGKSPLLLYGPQTDFAEVDRLRSAGARREPVQIEVLIYRKSGQTFWAEVDVVPVHLQGEAPEHFVVIARDVTERRQARQALDDLNAELEARVLARTAEANQARDEAERANRAKSAFLATMSHEIRTPMNGVMGMIDVLHQTSLKGYQVEMVDLIRDSADTLLAIIDDILDFSKIEAGKLHIERVPMQLAAAVEKVCAMLDHLAVKRGVRMMVFVDPAIPRRVAGDETRVRQVLVNLCSNAIKFSSGPGRAGEISVRVTLQAQDAHGVDIELAVADNGIGMDDAALARLFTPFSQADDSTTRRFGGTGLGLAITGTLVRLMGGEIAVRSAPAAGSTFSVRLRFGRVADAMNDEPAAAAAGLHCRIVGLEQPLAHDLGAYLAHAGALVEQLPDLAAAAAAPAPAGLCVWLILPGQDVPDLAALRAMAPAGSGGDNDSDSRTRFVVLGRGARRRLRVEAADLVSVDADAMFRSTLIKALSLAVGRAQKAPADDAAEAHAPTEAPPRHEARAQGRLILVAEDNETNRLVIERQLALIGCAADVVVNGREALEHWRSGDYALLLTDLHMPEMDGYALAAAIRADEAAAAGAPRTPILALTANALNDEARLCLAAGMDAYLTKPIRLAQLRQAIDAWLAPRAVQAVAIADRAAPVDLGVLEALVGDDPLAVRAVLKAFRVSALQMAEELLRAAGAGQQHALAAVSHKMKSGARAIGAARLGEICAAIEQAGGEEIADTLLPQVQGELQAVLAFLDRSEEASCD
jgi:PAS domain S-box-containing protein